jgi:hypothetical protein
MGATIYNSPVLMKELLEGAVRKIAGKDCGPQAVSNIVYSLKEMQYSWELLREETREALFHMIRQSSRDFNAQVRRKEKENMILIVIVVGFMQHLSQYSSDDKI